MTRRATKASGYPGFREIDGSHPFKAAAPGAYVEYAARRRRGGRVLYFNFALAKEMGLLPADHPERLNPTLRRAILRTFCLVIVNEYDLLKRTPALRSRWLGQRYMATRYLQLQHPGRQGLTSGDGRSIWNGTVNHRGVTWDISSCGTGVTCLCPATAENKEFYRTGSSHASYGCGTAGLDEGISAALMSETFHRNHVRTERMLAVIALPGGRSINVRAGRNLLRPSHFFAHLKRGDAHTLQAVVDLFIDRQIANGDWPALRGSARRYDFFARELARVFARTTARFESEYIFCWLDWDGDNILADGGIIDYGSVRQFGLYHREYRFDDGPRWSTTLPEQRKKARYLVQNFAQIRDFLLSGHRSPLGKFASDPILRLFDREFAATRDELLLARIGLSDDEVDLALRIGPTAVERFRRAHSYFERARARRGPCKVADGLSWNAIFSTRDLLRELPSHYRTEFEPIAADDFLEIAATSYASRRDRALTPHRRRMAREFQCAYLDLIFDIAENSGTTEASLLERIEARAQVINRRVRVTGDGIDYVTHRILRQHRRMSSQQLHAIIRAFISHQDRSQPARDPERLRAKDAQRLLDHLLRDLEDYRHGL